MEIMKLIDRLMEVDSMTDEEYGDKYGMNRRVVRAGIAAKLRAKLEYLERVRDRGIA